MTDNGAYSIKLVSYVQLKTIWPKRYYANSHQARLFHS